MARNNRKKTVHTVASLLERCEEDGDCMMWRGFHQNGTVPMVAHDGKLWSVRKLMAHLRGREVPGSGYWSVKCGFQSCVAPDHIIHRPSRAHFQAMNKKLFSNPALVALRNAKMGRHHRKLTDEQMRDLMQSSETHVAIAKRLGVSVSTVKRYRYGETGATLGTNTWLSMLRLGSGS